MMGIAQKVIRNFSDAVRSRGQSYFSKGRVTLMSARPNEVVARVRGTAKYRVRVRLRGMKLLASCSCPYFSPQGEPCKHLWATLLLADARGFLQTAPNAAVRLIAEPARRAPGAVPGLPGAGGPADAEFDPDAEGPYPAARVGQRMDMGGERLPRRRASRPGRGARRTARPPRGRRPGPAGDQRRLGPPAAARSPGRRPGQGQGHPRPARRAGQAGQPQRQAAAGLRPRRLGDPGP
ncbi:MAG: SWIM zinc finger family protein [Isosphaeraceae bacterium]